MRDTRALDVASVVVHLVDPLPFALATLLLTGIAFMRRGLPLAAAVLAILGGANVTTQVLKRLTFGPRAYNEGWAAMSDVALWPSGHTTAAATLALCVVLVAPTRWRPLAAAAGALFAIAVLYSLMVLNWHLPSDIVGGLLVSGTWTFATLATSWFVAPRAGVPAADEPELALRAVLTPAALAILVGGAAVALVIALKPQAALDHAIRHTAFALGAPLIAAAAVALTATLAVALRR